MATTGLVNVRLTIWLLLASGAAADADEAIRPDPCPDDAVVSHVLTQFAKYGPRSRANEYFGFIYQLDGRIESAVTHGHDCERLLDCAVYPAFALDRVPKGARVLGEWHTHPHIGTRSLSMEDVAGAHANRRIRCYTAFYSSSDGNIYRWSVDVGSVTEAMASLELVGNYFAQRRRDPVGVVRR